MGGSVGATLEKLMSSRSDNELLLFTLDEELVDFKVLLRFELPLLGGGATSYSKKKMKHESFSMNIFVLFLVN